jgi:hypothetical protein
MTSYYVYAIIPSAVDLPGELRGYHPRPAERLSVGDLTAIVALDASPPAPPTEEQVLAHHQLVTELSELGPVLPVRFGTRFPDRDAVRQSLAGRYDDLRRDMERLAGKSEFGITVLWERNEGEEAPLARTEPGSGASGAAYMSRRLEEYRRERELQRQAVDLCSEIETELGSVAEEVMLDPTPGAGIAVRGSVLARRGAGGDLRRAVNQLRVRHEPLRFLLSGPFPPYSFVNVGQPVRPGTHAAK